MSYSIGDKLALKDEREGTVVFIGSLQGKKGTFYGLILSKGKGDSDGSIGPRRYFTTSKGQGVFVTKHRVKASLLDNAQVEAMVRFISPL